MHNSRVGTFSGVGVVMNTGVRAAYRRIVFHVVKVPLMFFLITLGYIIEFLITLPFILITFIDGLFRKKAWASGDHPLSARKHLEEEEE